MNCVQFVVKSFPAGVIPNARAFTSGRRDLARTTPHSRRTTHTRVIQSGAAFQAKRRRVAHPFAAFSRKGGESPSLLCHLPHFHSSFWPLIQFHDTLFSQRVATIAAPCPLLRFHYQSSLHRIAMHVPQLLHTLPPAPDIEIVEPSLPYVRLFLGPQVQLRRTGSFSPPQYPARETLLHDLHHGRGSAFLRFADEQMNVLWHDHIAHQHEAVSSSRFFQNMQE